MPKEIVTSGGLFTGVAISGATDPTYEPTADDVDELLYCEVTATNGAGSAMKQSDATGEIIAPYGPELVIYPLDEVADSLDWNIVGNTVVRTGSGGSYSLETTELPTIGLTYRIALTVTGHSGDSFSARFGQGGGTNQVTGNGDWEFISVAANTNNLTFGAWDGTPAGATISNISVKEVL